MLVTEVVTVVEAQPLPSSVMARLKATVVVSAPPYSARRFSPMKPSSASFFRLARRMDRSLVRSNSAALGRSSRRANFAAISWIMRSSSLSSNCIVTLVSDSTQRHRLTQAVENCLIARMVILSGSEESRLFEYSEILRFAQDDSKNPFSSTCPDTLIP